MVCNQDVLSAYPRFLPKAVTENFQTARLDKLDPAISGFILYQGVGRQYPQLSHHNIFFSDDYPAEFRQLFDARRPADEPTIYVAVHAKADPDRAAYRDLALTPVADDELDTLEMFQVSEAARASASKASAART